MIKLERITDAKTIFAQAKEKGARGDEFDELAKRLEESNEVLTPAFVETEAVQQEQLNILNTLKLDQAIKLAKKKFKEGSSSEANRIYQDILFKFPKNKKAIDGIKAFSNESIVNASKIQDPPLDQIQPLINLYGQGKLQQTLEQAEDLLQQFPSSSGLHNICGAVYKGLGYLGASVDAYTNALSINPNFAEVYSNMGNVLKIQGKLEEAVDACKKAIAIKPNFTEAYYNMGNALKRQGKLEESIEAYKKALSIRPNFTEAYNNMGNVLKTAVFTKPDLKLQEIIISILDYKNYVNPSEISSASISLIKLEPQIKDLLEKYATDELNQSIEEICSTLLKLPLLLRLMSVCPLPDLELEKVIIYIRSIFLSSILEMTASSDLLRFQAALALQCFTNEYVYEQTESDTKALQILEFEVEKILLNGQQPNPQSVLCLASYKALHKYKWCSHLAVTTEIDEVLKRQVVEPKQEAFIKCEIPALQKITDKVSSKVMAQYEENPYPRWVNLGLKLKPVTISELIDDLKLRLFKDTINEVKAPNILIAGCGTGQHSIQTAAKFKNSKVLAIDLSLSSLAYAKRKSEELDFQNINYMQADILDLNNLSRQFDIIESAGVLHHMDDPMVGWRVLADCLKPGGLMRIGLYSELARKNIVKIREEIIQLGDGSSDIAIKSFRSGVINSDKDYHKQILGFNDFYTLSELRDLLFHVQEHRFTIPKIRDCLDELGLKFCGFGAVDIVQKFKLNNTDPDDPYDLNQWNKYEQANTSTFKSMYQFWCQKIA